MGTISFKSVGLTKVERKANTLAVTPTPIGIKTPVRDGGSDGIFAVNYDLADQMHDNLRNLILTNWGERLGLYDFGANLRPLLSEYTSQDDFDTSAVDRISSTVGRWMPYVSLEDFLSNVNYNNNGNRTPSINITVTYNIPALQIVGRALQLVLQII